MTYSQHARGAGSATPESGEAPSRDESAQGFREQAHDVSPDFRGEGCARQAAHVIEGEARARVFLARLHDDTAQPGELAALLSGLRGELLHGACRLIEKTLRGRHA